jgi:fucose permease
MLLAWFISSAICARLMLRIGYRLPAIIGMVLAVIGGAILTQLEPTSGKLLLIAGMFSLGTGFVLTVPALLIAV